MKISDYIKIEELKRVVTGQLVKLGLKEQVNGILDNDLNKLIALMGRMAVQLDEKDTDEEKIDFLLCYIIGIWGILIVDYNHDTEVL